MTPKTSTEICECGHEKKTHGEDGYCNGMVDGTTLNPKKFDISSGYVVCGDIPKCKKFTPQTSEEQYTCECGFKTDLAKELSMHILDKHKTPTLSDNYATDKRIMELFNNWFDPCPLNSNPEEDGLLIEWKDRTYVNPPYSNPLKWCIKAIEENKKGKTIVMLLRMDTSTKWFKILQENNALFLWINGRLRFGDTGKPAPFPSMLVILNKEIIKQEMGSDLI